MPAGGPTFNDIAECVSRMDKAQLQNLRQLIKLREDTLLATTRLQLQIGDTVRWLKKGGRHAGYHTGKIEKIGPKNIIVREEGGMLGAMNSIGLKWTIHPNFLEKVT